MNNTEPLPSQSAIDRLQFRLDCEPYIEPLLGKHCGLVLNQTSIARDGESTLRVLEKLGVQVTKLFSPEHGIEGALEGHVDDTSAHGRTVHSLYGETRRPTAAMLDGLDWLIFDIQDIGARFYTYSSTMALCMEACAECGVSLLVLDRPNPLGGDRVEGPFIDEELRSFVGHIRIPVVHGMTMGELALWHHRDAGPNTDLHVLPLSHWDRSTRWEDLQLPWVAPSPNIPNFEAANWYPGLCLLEFNDVSVGRGTDAPFQLLGAPWIKPDALSDALEAYWDDVDLAWETITFTPTRAVHEGTQCHGLRFSQPRGNFAFAPVTLGLALIAALHASHPDHFTTQAAQKCLPLLGNRRVLNDLLAGNLASALAIADQDARTWRQRRQESLLY